VVVLNEGRVVADGTVADLRRGTGARRYRVTSPDLDEATVEAVRARVDVTAVRRRDGTTRVEVATDSDGLYDLFALLRDRGVTLDGVETVEPDLGDVLLDLTGEES
jgi:ABC-2 type transport system ATP-binding protein